MGNETSAVDSASFRLQRLYQHMEQVVPLLKRYRKMEGSDRQQFKSWGQRLCHAARQHRRLRYAAPSSHWNRALAKVEGDVSALDNEVRAALQAMPSRRATAAGRSRGKRHRTKSPRRKSRSREGDRSFRVAKGYGTGQKGLLPRPTRGLLRPFGYHLHDTPAQRQRALDQAVRQYGARDVFQHINLISAYQRRVPEARRRLDQDKEYLRRFLRTYGGTGEYEPEPRRGRSRSRSRSSSRRPTHRSH